MTTRSQWPAPATRPDALGNPVARYAEVSGPRTPRRRWRLVRAWHAARGYWLVRRLARVEVELETLTAPLQGADGRSEISREDLLAGESCCIEIATLRAHIARCRALS